VTARPRQRAQAIIEFAVVVPLLLLLMLGLLDFSRLLFTYISLSNGAREMARAAVLTTNWSPTAPIDAFNNYTIVAGAQHASTDQMTITIGNAACATALDTGGTLPCSAPGTSTSVTCTLPLRSAACTLSPPPQDGFVQISLSYTFNFNPLFQNQVTAMGASFVPSLSVLTTTSRAYAE